MSDKIKVTYEEGQVITVEKGTLLYELSQQEKGTSPIMLAKVDGKYRELCVPIEKEIKTLQWIDLSYKEGMRVYQRSAIFMMLVAAKHLFKGIDIGVNHHIAGGYFCEFDDISYCTQDNINKLKQEMLNIVNQALPIKKETFDLQQAKELFEKAQMISKKELLKYRRTSTVNIYTLDGVKNYFYGGMLPNTERVKLFDIKLYEHGFVLRLPTDRNPVELSDFIPQPKLSAVFRESRKWAKIMEVDTVAALNKTIVNGEIKELIRISEALHEKKIAQIADQVHERQAIKLVLIAGPSSSGKTTFAQRLCTQLRVNGMSPHVISLDDYFVNREFTPRDEEGKEDFESIDAIDITLFNEHMEKLIAGEQVEIPSFNFVTGKREYNGNILQLKKEDILVVEGIHGLNEKLSYAVAKENKFKIYVSALTQLNVDSHNRIPTTDTRLIRRIIRDHQYRGLSAKRTLELWSSVRRGERRNIFPFQEQADVMFNTVLIYELAVLKQKAEPVLFSIEPHSPYYSEAQRLLKFLEYFLPVSSEDIPVNSIIREFIGGSCFR